MKVEHLFLGVCLLLLAATGLLAVHYRTELLVERERAKQAGLPSPVANASTAKAPVTAPPVATAPPTINPTGVLDRATERADAQKRNLVEQLKIAENEKAMLGPKVKPFENNVTSGLPPDSAPLTPQQLKIREAPAIAKIKDYKPDHGIVVLDHGADRGLKTDQVYAIRRGHYVVARRLVIGETVEANECAAIIDAASLQPGEVLRTGDEVIKWEQ